MPGVPLLFGSTNSEKEERSAVVTKEVEAIEEISFKLLQRCCRDSIARLVFDFGD